jgi:ribosomal subunit interface protein
MTNLPIHITTHHLSASNALHQFAREKISSVCRFANDALAADVVLRRHGGAKEHFSASVRLALPGSDIHGRAVAGNLYAAIGKLVAKLARLSRKRKTRLAKRFEHPGRSETSADLTVPPHAQEALPESAEAARLCISRAVLGKQPSLVVRLRLTSRRTEMKHSDMLCV